MFARKLIIAIVTIFVCVLIYQFFIIGVAINSNKDLYQIKVYDGYNTETFLSTEIISNDGKCITFVNMLDQETTQCSQNIGVTKLNRRKHETK